MSVPEYTAQGESVGAVVYFSSASRNTARFIANCRLQDEGVNVYRIPLNASEPALTVHEPYIIVVPTYGGGNASKAVPIQVKRFLNDPENRKFAQAVIATGNINFAESFCQAGYIISAKCNIPFLYYFELMGTSDDVRKVRQGVVDFFTNPSNTESIPAAAAPMEGNNANVNN